MRASERRSPLRGLLAATSFLTRFPLGGRAGRVTEEDLRAGAGWFPVVGALVGIGGATAGWLVAFRAPVALAGVVVVVVETVITGAFHLDGLADTADGIGAASTGRDGLRVMRDPTIGAFGAVAIVLDLALRIAATAAVLQTRAFPWAIVAAAGSARLAPVLLARRLPYLRPEGGSGSWVGGGVRTGTMIGAAVTTVLACSLAGGARGAAILATTLVVTFGVGRVARRSFGGATGDVFGASAELAQTIGLVAVVVTAGR